MPRGPRLDAPGVLHHVVVQGVEHRDIFPNDDDRADFVQRLARLLSETETRCLAWCLLPNQIQLALRSGPMGLAHVMRRVLTGYAVAFNRRHGRTGHLFQNRYQSIACEEEPYLLALVRYIHLQPLRAGVVPNVDALAAYPWCGHGALVGRVQYGWQGTAEVWARFEESAEPADRAYAAFVADGWGSDERSRPRTETAAREAARVMQNSLSDPRAEDHPVGVLGSVEFAASLRAPGAHQSQASPPDCRAVVEAVCRVLGLSPEALASGRRTRPLSNGRAVVAYVARTRYRISGTELAHALGMSPPGVTQAERRGAQLLKRRVDLRSGLREFFR